MRKLSTFFKKMTWLGLLLLTTIAMQGQQTGTLPVQDGMAVSTCFSGLATNGNGIPSISNPDGFVLGVQDIREPDCDASGNTDDSVTPDAPNNWTSASTGTYHDPSWTAENLGELFGVDICDLHTSPDIFVSSSGITDRYLAPSTLSNAANATGGDVFRIDGTTGAITHLVGLPNTQFTATDDANQVFNKYVGLGNLSYDCSNTVYVTNIDNGKIYALNATTGALVDSLDHHVVFNSGAANDGSRFITQLERWAYGISYNSCDGRIYYGIPTATATASGEEYVTQNSVYSVALNSDGTFDPTSINLELTQSAVNAEELSWGVVFTTIGDIEFSDDCTQMLIGERAFYRLSDNPSGIYGTMPHIGNVYRYTNNGGGWSYGNNYLMGVSNAGGEENSFGGVDFGYSNYGACGADNACDDAVVMMGDALSLAFNAGDPSLYGLQITPVAGNSSGYPNNSYYVDLDGVVLDGVSDKNDLGDVDVLSGCTKVANCTPPTPEISVTDNVCDPASNGSFNIVTDCGTGFTLEWSTDSGTTWSTTAPTYGTAPMTVMTRCVDDADPTCLAESTAVTSAPVDCPVYDVALTKTVDLAAASLGSPVVFTITVENLGDAVTGATVNDVLPTGLTYVSDSPSVGTYDGANWIIGNMAVGATETITITATADAEGVMTNTATASTNETETSLINNEDYACVSVPVQVCDNETINVDLVAEAGLSTYQWYKDGVAIAGATNQTYTATETGTYVYTVDGAGPTGDCEAELCCPIVIEQISCCAPINCLPVTITKLN